MLNEIVFDLIVLLLIAGGHSLAKGKNSPVATIAGIAVMGVVIGIASGISGAILAFWLGIAGSAGFLLGMWSRRRAKPKL